jgi:hypothetical protein
MSRASWIAKSRTTGRFAWSRPSNAEAPYNGTFHKPTLGNADLQPERACEVELGITKWTGKLRNLQPERACEVERRR